MGGGVVLFEFGVVVFDEDFHRPEFFEWLALDEDGNALKVVGQ